MDWLSTTAALAERGTSPVVVLDQGVVVLATRHVEARLGWRPAEMKGRSWLDLLARDDDRLSVSRWLTRPMAEDTAEFEVVAFGGSTAKVVTDVVVAGRGRTAARILTIRDIQRSGEREGESDIHYEISTAPVFGVLGWRSGSSVGSGRCYAVIHGRSAPCTDCPAIGDGTWPRVQVRHDGPGSTGLRVLTARSTGPDVVQVSSVGLSAEALAELQRTRVAQLAARARLTPRESELLSLLLLGGSLAEIAKALTLSERTVKFHQKNLLEKLGADSRADLIRILTF